MFIRQHSSEFPIVRMCHVLDVSRSAYYEWQKRPRSNRSLEDEILKIKIITIFEKSYGTYGQKRIKKELAKQHVRCSKKRIKRLTEEAGLTSRLRRKFKATTNSNHNYPIAPNLLKQDFVSVKPNEKWVGDITYIATEEGWLYLAAVQDLYTKKIVGWALGSRITKELTIRAMEQAIKKERPTAGLISHSDRGAQYAAYDYQDMLRRNKIRQSMSRKGNCYDNACAESFFATLKKDIIHGVRFTTRAEAKTKIVEYIEMFYNCTRIHSSIGDMSPIEFENMYYASVAA